MSILVDVRPTPIGMVFELQDEITHLELQIRRSQEALAGLPETHKEQRSEAAILTAIQTEEDGLKSISRGVECVQAAREHLKSSRVALADAQRSLISPRAALVVLEDDLRAKREALELVRKVPSRLVRLPSILSRIFDFAVIEGVRPLILAQINKFARGIVLATSSLWQDITWPRVRSSNEIKSHISRVGDTLPIDVSIHHTSVDPIASNLDAIRTGAHNLRSLVISTETAFHMRLVIGLLQSLHAPNLEELKLEITEPCQLDSSSPGRIFRAGHMPALNRVHYSNMPLTMCMPDSSRTSITHFHVDASKMWIFSDGSLLRTFFASLSSVTHLELNLWIANCGKGPSDPSQSLPALIDLTIYAEKDREVPQGSEMLANIMRAIKAANLNALLLRVRGPEIDTAFSLMHSLQGNPSRVTSLTIDELRTGEPTKVASAHARRAFQHLPALEILHINNSCAYVLLEALISDADSSKSSFDSLLLPKLRELHATFDPVDEDLHRVYEHSEEEYEFEYYMEERMELVRDLAFKRLIRTRVPLDKVAVKLRWRYEISQSIQNWFQDTANVQEWVLTQEEFEGDGEE